MGMFSLYKCPRCWESDCVCETDAHGDPRYSVLPSQGTSQPDRQIQQRQVELLEEQNRLLKKIAEKEAK